MGNTCGSFMAFMHKYFNTSMKFADFATNIHLELYLENEGSDNLSEKDYRIEYYFNDDFMLSIPYTEFKKKFENELYDKTNITDFCQRDENEEENERLYFIGIFVGLGIVGILVIVIIIVLRKRIKKNNEEQLAEENDALIRESKMSTE